MSDLRTLPRPFPLHHSTYLTDRPYRRLFLMTLRRAIELGIKFTIEWQHSGGCCDRQPQAVTFSDLLDELHADGLPIWNTTRPAAPGPESSIFEELVNSMELP